MLVSEIMSVDPACCDQQDTLQRAAELMRSRNCGELPIVNSQEFLVGVITDRDICCRAVADGCTPDRKVHEFMSAPAQTLRQDATVEECCEIMERHQVRRVPVVDAAGRCCGIVSLADIARSGEESRIGELMREIANPRRVSAYLR